MIACSAMAWRSLGRAWGNGPTGRLVAFGAGVALFGCSLEAVKSESTRVEPAALTTSAEPLDIRSASGAASVATAPNVGDSESPGVVVHPHDVALANFDYATLRGLEAAGFGFAQMALGESGEVSSTREFLTTNNRSLMSNLGYASIAAALASDLDEFARADRAAGVGMKFAHRTFDKRWLESEAFHYELVAVVHRVDRRVFAPETCGELRLIYRLAYHSQVKGKTAASRVPMTVNVVRWVNDPGCHRWLPAMARVAESSASDAAASWTAMGAPLSPELFAITSTKSVEVNLQSVRWPSTVRPNMAGHAEYLLRVFHRESTHGPFVAAPLENTPDVARLSRDAGLRARLIEWLRAPERQAAIALGTVMIPNEYLSTRATSLAPHGMARQGNRPFTVALGASWGEDPHALSTLRRLDGLSCPGCHQSRSVAGFHVLGNEAPGKQWDKLAVPHSPHVSDEMQRRRAYMEVLLRGGQPKEYRPPAEHPDRAGGWGSRCGLSSSPLEGSAGWTCQEGLTCRAVDDPDVGECLPNVPGVGDACETGVTSWGSGHRDSTRLSAAVSCGAGNSCERNAVGFPGGMCSAGCEGLPSAHGVCGGIAVLDSFNACVARGEIFETCLATTTRPGALRRCSHDEPCRDDYVCASTEDGQGACLPPYFLFQLRVDGHVY